MVQVEAECMYGTFSQEARTHHHKRSWVKGAGVLALCCLAAVVSINRTKASSTQLLTESKQDQAAGVASTPTIFKGHFEASEQPPKDSRHLLKPEGAKAKPTLSIKNNPTIQKMQLSQKQAKALREHRVKVEARKDYKAKLAAAVAAQPKGTPVKVPKGLSVKQAKEEALLSYEKTMQANLKKYHEVKGGTLHSTLVAAKAANAKAAKSAIHASGDVKIKAAAKPKLAHTPAKTETAPAHIHQSWKQQMAVTMKDSAAHDWSHTSDLAITSGYTEPSKDADDNFHNADLKLVTSHAPPTERRDAKISHVHNVFHTEDVSTVVNLKNKMPEQSMAEPSETGSTDWTHQTDLLMTNGNKMVSAAGAPVHDYTHQADAAAIHSKKTILAADRAHDYNHQADLSTLVATSSKQLGPAKFIDPDHDYDHVNDQAELLGAAVKVDKPKSTSTLAQESDPYHNEDMENEFGHGRQKTMLHDDIGHDWDHADDAEAVNQGLGGRYEDYA